MSSATKIYFLQVEEKYLRRTNEAVRLPDSFVKCDLSLNGAELWNHRELLILGSWGLPGNRGGKGQMLMITATSRWNNISYHFLGIRHVLGIVISALHILLLIFIDSFTV